MGLDAVMGMVSSGSGSGSMCAGSVGGWFALGRQSLRSFGLRCCSSRKAGSAQTRCAQTRAALIRLSLRCSPETLIAAPRQTTRRRGHSRCAFDAPITVSKVARRCLLKQSRREPLALLTTEPGMRCGLGGTLAAPLRNGAQGGSGPRVFERSEFARTPPGASTARKPDGPVQRVRPTRTAYRAHSPTNACLLPLTNRTPNCRATETAPRPT